jgi:hypothetical protein
MAKLMRNLERLNQWPYGLDELKEVDGVWQVVKPHEDIHNTDYFESKKDYNGFINDLRRAVYTNAAFFSKNPY